MSSPHLNNNSVLDSLNFFNSSQFFRFNKRPKTHNRAAKICSLIFIVLIVIFLILALMEVFSGTETQSTQSSEYVGTSSLMQLVADGRSFMLALQNNNFQTAQTSSGTVVTTIAQIINGSIVGSAIVTQKCTVNHFQSISGISTIFSQQNMQNWDCLPLNTILQVDIQQSQYTGVKIILLCTNCSGSSIVKTNLHFITPINPQSQRNSLTYGINSNHYVLLQSNAKSYMSVDLSQYVTKSEGSQISSGVTVSDISSKQKVYSSSASIASAEITIQKSAIKIIYSTSTVSSNGFNSFTFFGGLLIIFLLFLFVLFMMKSFSQSCLDMAAASKMYNDKQSQSYNFGHFVAQGILNILNKIGFEPEWNQAQYFNDVQHKINCLRDIIYLESRIHLLQTALTILLDSHQLTALHLANQSSLDKAYQKYQQYQLKKTVVQYFKIKVKGTEKGNREDLQKQNQQSRGTSTQLKKNSSKSEVNNLKIENNFDTQAQISQEVQQRYTKYIQEYLEIAENNSDYFELQNEHQMQYMTTRTRQQLEILRCQVEESKDNYLSRKVFDVLVESDRRFVELLMRMPQQKRIQGLQIVIYPSRSATNLPSTMTTLP